MGIAQGPSLGDGSTAVLLQQTADDLGAEAIRHKRAAAFHRRQARSRLQARDRLEATCRALGIRLVIHPVTVEGDADL